MTSFELKPESDGQYQLKTRFAKFMNLPELMSMFKECADIRTADTLNLPRPESETIDVVAEPSKIQRKMIKNLGKRAAKIRTGSVDPRDDNMLCVTNDGRKIGLDQRLIDSSLPQDFTNQSSIKVVEAGILMDVRFLHFKKANIRIVETELGMLIFFNSQQPAKVNLVISIIVFGITIEIKRVHPAKAPILIWSTVAGMVNDTILEHPLKAMVPISFTDVGIVSTLNFPPGQQIRVD